jgi:hypothetical protein
LCFDHTPPSVDSDVERKRDDDAGVATLERCGARDATRLCAAVKQGALKGSDGDGIIMIHALKRWLLQRPPRLRSGKAHNLFSADSRGRDVKNLSTLKLIFGICHGGRCEGTRTIRDVDR